MRRIFASAIAKHAEVDGAGYGGSSSRKDIAACAAALYPSATSAFQPGGEPVDMPHRMMEHLAEMLDHVTPL